MKLMIEIDEARFKDIQRIAEVQLESNHFQTAEQIIASGSDVLDKIRAEIKDRPSCMLSTSSEFERGVNAMLRQSLMIIDKYKAESEE